MSTEAERTMEAYQRSAFNVDGWVIMYPPCRDGAMLFVTVHGEIHGSDGWGGGSLNTCTVFGTWEEASKVAVRIPYIMKQPPHLRRIIKVKIQHSAELIEEHPIGVLDALAEL